MFKGYSILLSPCFTNSSILFPKFHHVSPAPGRPPASHPAPAPSFGASAAPGGHGHAVDFGRIGAGARNRWEWRNGQTVFGELEVLNTVFMVSYMVHMVLFERYPWIFNIYVN